MTELILFAGNTDAMPKIMTPDNFLHGPLMQSVAKGSAVEDAPQSRTIPHESVSNFTSGEVVSFKVFKRVPFVSCDLNCVGKLNSSDVFMIL